MTVRIFDQRSRAFKPVSVPAINLKDTPSAVWIDLMAPRNEEIREIGEKFGFHQLAIEDAQKRRQRPKTDFYSDHVFVVFYAIEPTLDGSTVRSHEIGMFARSDLVVTIRAEEIPELDTAGQRWSDHCDDKDDDHAGMLVYTIVDSVVDGYFPCMDGIAEDIDALESSLFDSVDGDSLQRIFVLKRSLLDLRRVIAPSRDVFNAFTRWELPALGQESVYYFQDVYDHVIRVTDQIDAYRDVLASAIDIHLSVVSNRMNQTVRTLTAASIVLMSLALIAGIYGMNFEYIPELRWHFGYFGALGIMAVLGSTLVIYFRKLGWW